MACILGTGLSGIASVYELDTTFILKGYEVWHKGRCVMRFYPAEDSRAALATEDTAENGWPCRKQEVQLKHKMHFQNHALAVHGAVS
jgi:hypothetical protein